MILAAILVGTGLAFNGALVIVRALVARARDQERRDLDQYLADVEAYANGQPVTVR